MNADDDGFCEHFMVMRMTENKPDNLKVLQVKEFIRVFDDKVLIITDWKENNYLRSDRYSPSKYLEIYKEELRLLAVGNVDTSGIPNGNQGYPQDRLGKVRLGKGTLSSPKATGVPFEEFWSLYPKKVEKKKAQEKWDKLDRAIQELVIADLPSRVNDDGWKRGFVPNPTTYLNGERWNDEIQASKYPARKLIVIN